MSERHRVLEHVTSLGEIDEILSAMHNLAYVEISRINQVITAQRSNLAMLDELAQEFYHHYRDTLPHHHHEGDIICLIGSERGLCGDFNHHLAQAALQQESALKQAAGRIMIGSRLFSHEELPEAIQLEGPGMIEDVPAAIAHLLTTLSKVIQRPHGLVVVSHQADGVKWRRVLPFAPAAHRQSPFQPYPLLLNLAPQRFLTGFIEHYLSGVLYELFYESLLAENQQRLEHMQQARDRIGEKLADLDRKQKRLRQEEITQEIEIILLSAGLDKKSLR